MIRSGIVGFVVGVVLGQGVAAVASADTFKVPGVFPTIQAGIDAAALGDTVLVAPGRYEDVVTREGTTVAFFLKDGVKVLSEGGSKVTTVHVADPDAYRIVEGRSLPSVETAVEGFTFTSVPLPSTAFYVANVGKITVRDCVFMSLVEDPNAGLRVHSGDLLVEQCQFFNCGSDAALRHDAGHLVVRDCRFERCANRGVLAQPGDVDHPMLIEDCIFIDCEAATGGAIKAAARPAGSTIRRCTFQSNRASESGGAVEFWQPGVVLIEDSVFLDNEVTETGHGGALTLRGGVTRTVRRCTFWRNGTELAERGAAVHLLFGATTVLESNVFGASSGAVAVYGDLGAAPNLSSCNIFLDNAAGNAGGTYFLGPTDEEIAPQFCNVSRGDLQVTASSPCLPENNWNECGQIGAFGQGCESRGFFPVGVRTMPDDLPVLVDGVERGSPWMGTWPVGGMHALSAPRSIQPAAEARYTFDSWSDAGAETHVVVALDKFVEYTAVFNAEYFVSGVVDSGGTAVPSGWVPRGQTVEVTALPDSGWSFVAWEGEGEGSYSGTDNPALVTPTSPIVQKAIFFNEAPLLTMNVQGGGSAIPATSRQTFRTLVPIEAIPNEGWTFLEWIGEGLGSYNGADNPAQVAMEEPLSQLAVFVSATPLLTVQVEGGGTATPETGPQGIFEDVEIAAMPDLGWDFFGWSGLGSGSYSGGNNPATVTMNEPITQTATFVVGELPLTMLAKGGGTVTPESGLRTSFTDVEIRATPDPGHRFVEWTGTGDGAYTGSDNPATVTLSGPITQVAHFAPAAFNVALSLSDTDPYVHTGGPVGLGDVHLWVTCGSTEHGLQAVSLTVSGSLQPLAFLPAPGVSAAGTTFLVAGIDGCPSGPVRLGKFLVNTPGEGSLCLDGSDPATGLTIIDCQGTPYSWPANVGFVGVHTGGDLPCGDGTGCEEIDPLAVPVGMPETGREPSATGLAGVFPNPSGSGTTIHFDVARSMDVQVEVFDVAGRQVRAVWHGSVAVGRHSVGWDGRDSSGRAVAGGMYFVRLTGDGVDQTEKVTVLRGP